MILNVEKIETNDLNCVQSVIKALATFFHKDYHMIFYKSFAFGVDMTKLYSNKSVLSLLDNSEKICFEKLATFHNINVDFSEYKNVEAVRQLENGTPLVVIMKAKDVDWCNNISDNRIHIFLVIGIDIDNIVVYDPYYSNEYLMRKLTLLNKAIKVGFCHVGNSNKRYSSRDFIISNFQFFLENLSQQKLKTLYDNIDLIIEHQCYSYSHAPEKSAFLKNLKEIQNLYKNLLYFINNTLICDINVSEKEHINNILVFQMRKWENIRLLLIKNCIYGIKDNTHIRLAIKKILESCDEVEKCLKCIF